MSRSFWIAFGGVNHAVFFATVWFLFWFLKGAPPAAAASGAPDLDLALALDLALGLLFAVSHSVLLLPAVRSRLERWIPSHSYGCFFCLITCLNLLLTIALWQTSSIVVWRFTGIGVRAIEAAFYGSWVLLLYSLSLSGYGHQTGFTPWWSWVRGRPAERRRFEPRGVYRLMRHPGYAAFLGLVWFTPVVTLDRALLIGVWTAYVFIGSHLKDRRMLHYLGERYATYQSQVTGYPGMIWGPLGRVARNGSPQSAATTAP